MKKILLTTFAFFTLLHPLANPDKKEIEPEKNPPKEYVLDELIVTSTKETHQLNKIPSARSLLTFNQISRLNITSLRDISTLIPNLYIPSYGSKMTTPIYLRGVGTRSSDQSVGFYVDGIPYMDKSTLNFELIDLQEIEVLRGPQGTLYGRNAMGGIISIQTFSPLTYEGTRIKLGAGNHGQYSAQASHYNRLSQNVGLSFGGYYSHLDGFFRNSFDGKKVDKENSAGGKLRLDAQLTPSLLMKIQSSFDYTNQGAYPYARYGRELVAGKPLPPGEDELPTETKPKPGEIAPIDYNDEGSYRRAINNSSIRFEYSTGNVLFSSSTGYQYLNDNMVMDQDYTRLSIFTINQRQKQHSINQEFVVRSKSENRYQWSTGMFGFYNNMKTIGNVTFKEDGIKHILQPVFDDMPPQMPVRMTIKDKEIKNPGTYKMPSAGVAIFHQSTVNDLFTDGLSLTAGIRLDYERQRLRYDTRINMQVGLSTQMPIPIPKEMSIGDTLQGRTTQHFWQLLPKIALQYEFNPTNMVYMTVAKGYKTGGYNNQMFSEVIQDSLMAKYNPNPETPEYTLEDVISYQPETTWNYEIGGRFDGLFGGAVDIHTSLFFMSIRDIQLTKFVDGGSGRVLANAGRGRSYGVELSLRARPVNNLTLDLNYGYTHAKFTKYDGGESKDGATVDYTGNFIPYTPRHTLSIGASYLIPLRSKVLRHIQISTDYSGCGGIFWNEQNSVDQSFYGLLNAKISIQHTKTVNLEIWARNITSKKYGTFYFESFNRSFVQRGLPFTIGVNLSFTF